MTDYLGDTPSYLKHIYFIHSERGAVLLRTGSAISGFFKLNFHCIHIKIIHLNLQMYTVYSLTTPSTPLRF